VLRDLYHHRAYIWQSAIADVRHRYAGSAGGVLWNIFQPLALIIVFSVVFTSVIDRAALSGVEGHVSYAVYLCSLLLPWIALSDCLNRGTSALTGSAALLRRLAIPESVFTAKTAVSAAIGLVISFTLFLIIAVTALGLTPHWTWLLLPIPMALLMILGFGVAMALGTLHAFIRDTALLVTIMIQVGFWSYPIVYDASFLPPWAAQLVSWNPVAPYFDTIRGIVLRAEAPTLANTLGMLGWSLVACALGAAILKALQAQLRDVI
jgi:ABC-type polysaccharide/polyol phosphate export permease